MIQICCLKDLTKLTQRDIEKLAEYGEATQETVVVLAATTLYKEVWEAYY